MPNEINYLTTSFQEKEQVKSLGAKWDVTAKKWYVPEGMDLKPFENWLANTHAPTITTSGRFKQTSSKFHEILGFESLV
jgi:hypothetical protein